MQFDLDNGTATYHIRSYQKGAVIVNDQTYRYPLLVTPERLIAPWGPADLSALNAQHIADLSALEPQVVLFGTGNTRQVPPLKLLSVLMEHKIGFEIMDLGAACRTYTVLMAEGRRVAAALFF